MAPHGREWREIEGKSIETLGLYARNASINWPYHVAHKPFHEKQPIDYFNLMHPHNWHKMKDSTNSTILNEDDKITVGTLQTWLGLIFAMMLDPVRGDRGDYWQTKAEDESVILPRNFGSRFKMTKNKFEMIMKNFKIEPPKPPDNTDDFYHIRSYIEEFNRHRLQVVTAGQGICVDEIMSYYEGMSSKYSATGCPSQTKQARKPLPIGHELKAACDVDTNIIIKVELQEGSIKMRQKEYVEEFGHSTAVTLRLTKPFHGTGRVGIFDSYFGSAKSCMELEKKGMFSQMMVKQCHTGYPKRFFEIYLEGVDMRNDRGAHKIVETTYESRTPTGKAVQKKMYGLAWADKKGKMIIFNKGTTNEGNPSIRRRHRKITNDQGTNNNIITEYQYIY